MWNLIKISSRKWRPSHPTIETTFLKKSRWKLFPMNETSEGLVANARKRYSDYVWIISAPFSKLDCSVWGLKEALTWRTMMCTRREICLRITVVYSSPIFSCIFWCYDTIWFIIRTDRVCFLQLVSEFCLPLNIKHEISTNCFIVYEFSLIRFPNVPMY